MLNKRQIKQLIEKEGLLEHYLNLDKQLTPQGFDLTVQQIFRFSSCGCLDFSNKERLLSDAEEILPEKINPQDKFGWWHLKPGSYKVKTNETVNLPSNLAALAFSRTSLLRSGAFTQHGVWDAGFKGKGEFILAVGNSAGIKIKQNARIAQLIFLNVAETEEYKGIYKHLT